MRSPPSRLRWLFLVGLLAGCAAVRPPSQDPRGPAPTLEPTAGPVRHVVLIWLKDPDNASHQQAIVDQARRFAIPGLIGVAPGLAVPAQRPVTDDSFDLGLIFTFENVAALRAYESDPVHNQAIKEKLLPITRRVQVFDLVDRFPPSAEAKAKGSNHP